MKIEKPVGSTKNVTEELLHKASISKTSGSKKATETKTKESYVSHEIKVLRDLKKGTFQKYVLSV